MAISITGSAAEAESQARAVTVRDGVVYARPGGKPVRLTLFVPREKNPAPRPAIILIHGGAWTVGTRQQLRWYGNRFARQGYVAASISYRKMPGVAFPGCLQDAKAAVRWMRAQADTYHIDPARVFVCGNSAGGHLAAMLAATPDVLEFAGMENSGYDSSVRAAISIYGPVDLRVYRAPETWIRVAGVSTRIIERFVGANARSSDLPFQMASPITYFSEKTAPILFIHGDRDNLVPLASVERAHEQLRALGVPTRLLMVHARGHGFDHIFPRARRRIFRQMLAFLEAHGAAAIGPAYEE